jgi:hypothetical protein
MKEIHALGGKIKKNTIQGFYEKNIRNRNCYASTLDDIGLWIDSKNNKNLDSNEEQREGTLILWVRARVIPPLKHPLLHLLA